MLMPTNHATSPSPTIATSLPFDGPCICHIPTTAPPLIKGCGRTTSTMSPTANNNCPCHITWKKCLPSNTMSQRLRERGVQKGSRRGKERERGNCGWGGGHLCPLPPAATFQRPARWCASHIPSCLSFFIPPHHLGGSFPRMRQHGIHTPPCLRWIIPPNDGGILYQQQ